MSALEEEFIGTFEGCADQLFRDSLERLGSRVEAFALTQAAFEESWEEVVRGTGAGEELIRTRLEELISGYQSLLGSYFKPPSVFMYISWRKV